MNWYLVYDLKVDGKFGAMTRRAVIEFQKKKDITADGIFGTASLAKAKVARK